MTNHHEIEGQINEAEIKATTVLSSLGYYTANLWHLDDIRSYFVCEDEEAKDILHKVLTSQYIMQIINENIHKECEFRGLQRRPLPY